MARWKQRSALRLLSLLWLAPTSLVCASSQPLPGAPSAHDTVDSLLTLEASPPGDRAFPPPAVPREARASLPTDLGIHDTAEPLEVAGPSLDGSGSFRVIGSQMHVSFNQAVELPARAAKSGDAPIPAAPGTVRITPDVPFDARWLDPYTLDITAKKPFDAKTTYAIAIEGLKTTSGKTLEHGWQASFQATPSVQIAGKELGYVPVPGEHRPIVVHPADGSTFGRSRAMSVLFDQPIDLGLARKLITLEGPGGASIPAVIAHPTGPTFQGVKIDPRLAVIVRPRSPLAYGQKVSLHAHAAAAKDGARDTSSTFAVAEALQQTAVGCGSARWDDDDACSVDHGLLRMSGQTLHIQLNNPIDLDHKALARLVHVTPRVRNLTVQNEGWDDARIVLRGGFESSQTYDITVAGLQDRYGSRLDRPLQLKVQTLPLGASVTMPEGVIALDQAATRGFTVTTRNVAAGQILAWPVPARDAASLDKALAMARSRSVPDDREPIRVPFTAKGARDKTVETAIDLGTRLDPGASYLATVQVTEAAFGAMQVSYPRGSEAGRPAVALLTTHAPGAISVHARMTPGATLVQVARLGSGEPVAGAAVRFAEDEAARATSTDANGIAWLGEGEGKKVVARAGDHETWLALDQGGATSEQLFPDLAKGEAGSSTDARRAMVITDRGIYRPGSTVQIKASVRVADGDKLLPLAGAPLRVVIVGPTGDDVFTLDTAADDLGSVAASFAVPADAKLGRHELRVVAPDREQPLASSIVQVAEFEPPRFAVDVDAEGDAGATLKAVVRARYLFGAPMDSGRVSWTLRRDAAPFPDGPLTAAGLKFRDAPGWYDEPAADTWSRSGEAVLRADGTLAIEQALPLADANGPQAFVLEADVSDSSNRHIAARTSIVKHPRPRYAGVRLTKSWAGVGEKLPVELGVIDTTGKPVIGAAVVAKLERVEWSYSRQRSAGGALRWTWTRRRIEAGRCSVKSAYQAARCDIQAPRTGDYEVTAEVDGQRGGSASFWAWRDGEDKVAARPSRGRVIQLVADKASYAPGETAKLLVQSPYRAATAILTAEQGGVTFRSVVRLGAGAALLELPVTAASAPHMHAVVTLLPLGEKRDLALDYRIAALRIPVSPGAARLDVATRSDRPSYGPGEEASITIDVRDGATPSAGAEVALAIVDEGVLRMTAFRAKDPVSAMRPGRALSFRLRDSREGLAELLDRSHVAGDGGGPDMSTITGARKDFVETALWRPSLRTDAQGRATVKFKLPDNLTEFRMMAVVLDRDGKGAASESSFTVKKPVMLIPVVPRFAAVGDRFEVAAMLHNQQASTLAATVTLGDRKSTVSVPGGGHTRVGFSYDAVAVGPQTLRFAVQDARGEVLDRVEAPLRIDAPGVEERPRLAGAFRKSQAIALAVPASVELRGDETMRIQVGQRLWPELGARLEFLLGYPHGCVEQTTSSTLPLLAARAILPRIGFTGTTDAQLTARIRVGLERFATMRTSSGGLAYWPGGDEPNVYGTAYAMRAVVLARAGGIATPSGLLEGMKGYLADEMLSSATKPEVAAAIAQSLAEMGELPASAADALFDRRGDGSVFGKASLALALSSLEGQEDRVEALLDDVEAALDDQGQLRERVRSDDFYYYGSPTRTRSQAAVALARLRRGANVLPTLMSSLAAHTDAYTTQATAYSLLAVAEELRATVGDGAKARVLLDGHELAGAKDLGFGSKEYSVPVASLRGRTAALRLEGDGDGAFGYLVSASWRAPLAGGGSVAGTRTQTGPDVHRAYTDAKGVAVDLARVRAGDVVRVAVLVHMPEGLARDRLGYLAVTDRLPAGFEPIQPDLATVARVADITDAHPFASAMRWGSTPATHVELRDDRVSLYFDRIDDAYVVGSYLVRASTPGQFILPPAAAELMYEGDSVGYSEAGRVVIQ